MKRINTDVNCTVAPFWKSERPGFTSPVGFWKIYRPTLSEIYTCLHDEKDVSLEKCLEGFGERLMFLNCLNRDSWVELCSSNIDFSTLLFLAGALREGKEENSCQTKSCICWMGWVSLIRRQSHSRVFLKDRNMRQETGMQVIYMSWPPFLWQTKYEF